MSNHKSADELLEAMERLKRDIPPLTDWTLVAPDGRVWVGPPPALARVFVQNITVESLFDAAKATGGKA